MKCQGKVMLNIQAITSAIFLLGLECRLPKIAGDLVTFSVGQLSATPFGMQPEYFTELMYFHETYMLRGRISEIFERIVCPNTCK